jgi:hypothetical protein
MIVSSARLPGNAVVDAGGGNVGRLDCLMIDVASGRIAYAVVSCGGVMGLGAKHCAVEWDDLRLDPERRCFVLERAPQDLAQSPA